MSLTTRFLSGFAVICAVGLYLLMSLVLKRVERQYMEAAEEPMVDVANILAEALAVQMKAGMLDAEPLTAALKSAQERKLVAVIYNLLKERVDMHAYVTDAEGRVLMDSSGREKPGSIINHHRDVFLTLNQRYGARVSRSSPGDPLSMVMYVGAPIVVDGRLAGMISVAKPQRSLLVFIRETERWLKWATFSVVAFMVLGSYLVARWATRPLNELTRHALAVGRGERPPPPAMPGHQMKTLGQALENMRDALEGRDYVETYVQSLTHELKSPVAAILGAGEILQGEVPEPQRSRFLQNIRSEAERLRDLLERLLHLAALEKRKGLENRGPVNIRTLVQQAWDHLALTAAAREVALKCDMNPDLSIPGDPWLLELAVSNLLQNALDFAPPGSVITAAAMRAGGSAVLTIEDAGPGIPDYARERVFERFYSLPRPGTGKKSTGLGLCFVREIAQLHGGRAALDNRAEGPGAMAVLELPAGVPGMN